MRLRSSCGLVMVFLLLPQGIRAHEPSIAYGTVVDGRFVSLVEEGTHSSTGLTWYCGDLPSSRVRTLRSVIPIKGDVLSRMSQFRGTFGPPPFGPSRWRIRSGYLWSCILNSLGSNTMENRSFFQIEFGWYRRFKRDAVAEGEPVVTAGSESWPSSFTQDWLPRGKIRSIQLIASGDILSSVGLRKERPEFWTYDFIPLGPRRLRLFLLVEDVMEVWQYHFKPGQWQDRDIEGAAIRKRDVWLGKWTRHAEFPAPFSEPFHVTETSDGVACVTDSGKCFLAEKGDDDKWTIRAIWDDESRPLIALVDVPDQKESYAFAKDFYFLLTENLEVVECRDVTLNRTDHGEPLRTSWECAKVLYEEGRIVIPEKDNDAKAEEE